MSKCAFCEEFKWQLDREIEGLRYEYSAVLERSVYEKHFLFKGKGSRHPLRFCPECGKRLDGQEKPCGDCPAVFAVKAMAASDLQPVVRCKDCKYFETELDHPYGPWCNWHHFDAAYNDFCNCGERRRTDD